jgi:hypothetical protein
VAPQNARIVTTAAARDVRGESDGDDSKDIHAGKLAPVTSSEIPVIVVAVIVLPVVTPATVGAVILGVCASITLANRLLPQPRLFNLSRTNLLVATDLTLARDLELTLALDLQLALACDLELALPPDLVLVDPIVVVAVISVHARTVDQVRVHRKAPRRDFAVHRGRLTARRNAVDPDPAHARGRHLTRRNPEDSLGQNGAREDKRRRGRQQMEFAHLLSPLVGELNSLALPKGTDGAELAFGVTRCIAMT